MSLSTGQRTGLTPQSCGCVQTDSLSNVAVATPHAQPAVEPFAEQPAPGINGAVNQGAGFRANTGSDNP